jgi:hypothetical protein
MMSANMIEALVLFFISSPPTGSLTSFNIISVHYLLIIPPFNSAELKLSKFKVYKSVQHHTIQINHQLDATIFPVYYLTFIYSSTCFGRPHAHHQELNNCSSNFWLYLRSVVIAVWLVVVGPTGPTTTNSTAITTLRR